MTRKGSFGSIKSMSRWIDQTRKRLRVQMHMHVQVNLDYFLLKKRRFTRVHGFVRHS
jgi:hypothetical protein